MQVQGYYKATKQFNDVDEFLDSPEFEGIFKGIDKRDMERRKKIMRENQFERGFVVPVDPEKNYGRDYKLFRLYKASDGLRILREIEPFSVMGNNPWRWVYVYPEGFTITPFRLPRENRNEIIERGVVVIG